MNKVKRQHYVPQFYLKQWHNEKSNEQIYVFNKDLGKCYSTNVEGISSSKYFYDYPDLNEEQKKEYIDKVNKDETLTSSEKKLLIDNIDKQVIENALGEIESINSVIQKTIIERLDNIKALPLNYFLQHSFIKDDEIQELSYFIALQYSRTEEMRIAQNDMNKLFVKITADNIHRNIDKVGKDTELVKKMGGKDEFNKFKAKVKSDEFNSDSYTIDINETYRKITHLASIFDLAERIAIYLKNYKWIILVNNTNIPYITTDNPVVKNNNLDSIYSSGFASRGIEIIYPISPRYAISIWEPSYFKEKAPDLFNQTIIQVKESNVIHNNDLLIQNATSQIYSNKNDFTWAKKRISETPTIANKHRQRIAFS